MSEVRFQPQSAPRSTSIARTTMKPSKPSGSGQNITSSPASSPAARAHVQGNQNRNIGGAGALVRPSAGTPSTAIEFSIDELNVLGQLTSQAISRIAEHVRQPGITPEQSAEAAAAYEHATKALDKIGAELQRRGA